MEEAGGESLSRLLGQSEEWKNLREYMIEQYNSTCQICVYQAKEAKQLYVHENWEVKGDILLFMSVGLICSRCYACKHRNQYAAFRVMDGQPELDMGYSELIYLQFI